MSKIEWLANVTTNEIIIRKNIKIFNVPKFRIKVDDSLAFTIQIFDWFMPEDHKIYKSTKRSLKNITITNLIHTLNSYNICSGVDTNELSEKLTYYSMKKVFYSMLI